MGATEERGKPVVRSVEDDLGHQRLLELLMRRSGFACDCAFDGASGLEKALANTYDLIILDINIPEIDGLEVARRIREHGAKTPLVAVTALQTRELERKAMAAGFDGFYQKPIDDAMVSRITEQFGVGRRH
jgi:DNA-binding response OmpR family regulator